MVHCPTVDVYLRVRLERWLVEHGCKCALLLLELSLHSVEFLADLCVDYMLQPLLLDHSLVHERSKGDLEGLAHGVNSDSHTFWLISIFVLALGLQPWHRQVVIGNGFYFNCVTESLRREFITFVEQINTSSFWA